MEGPTGSTVGLEQSEWGRIVGVREGPCETHY